MHEVLGVADTPEEINREVVRRMLAKYSERLPLIAGTVDAVQRITRRWPLGLASSSNRELIERALEASGLASLFCATVSSEEVEHGKPAPDVYLEACRRLGVEPRRAAAVEDSRNGILSARAAGLRVIAIPNAAFPPDAGALAAADVVLDALGALTEAQVTRALAWNPPGEPPLGSPPRTSVPRSVAQVVDVVVAKVSRRPATARR